MNCAEFELLICDYVDGALDAVEKAAADRHMAMCPACAELAADAVAGAKFLALAEPVEPPPALVNRLLFQAPWRQPKSRLRRWLEAAASPILQPRYAMGAAMTILSFAIMARFVTPIRQLRPTDLRPVAVWKTLENNADRAWDRTVKFYDNLKFVYQIQARLREWQQRDDEPAARPALPARDERELPVRPPAASGEKPSQ